MQSLQAEVFYPLQSQTRIVGLPTLGSPYDEFKQLQTELYESPEKKNSNEPSLFPLCENDEGLKPTLKLSPTQSQEQRLSLKDLKAQLEKKIETFLQTKNERQVPIPKGNSAYSKAKRAEYVDRDLDKAVKFYKLAIKNNERVDSAIKDLATVLHQQGKTQEACNFLQNFRSFYRGDLNKYDNLWNNLMKQITPSGNCLNRTFVLPNVSLSSTESDMRALFGNDSRIVDVSFCHNWTEEEVSALPPLQPGTKLCLISFVSYSAARKTFETLKETSAQDFYWMNTRGEVLLRAANDSLNNSRSSDEKEVPKKSFLINTNGQPIRRSSFFLEHSAKMSKGSTPTQQSDNFQYGFYPQNLHPMLRQAPSWDSDRFQPPSPYPTNNHDVVKRLSFREPMTKNPLAGIAPRKRWSVCNIPPQQEPEKTWNCAVFVDMEDETSSESDEEEEVKDPEVKIRKQERTNSLRELVFQEFGEKRFPLSQDTLSTGTSRSDVGLSPSKGMKYDVWSDIKMKEELLQRQKSNDSNNFLQNLILRRNNVLNEEFKLATDPRKQGDRRTSWDPSLLRRANPWDGSEESNKILQNLV